MKCDKVLSQLSVFLDEMLEDDRTVQVSRHLDQCPNCRKQFEALVQIRRRLAALGPVAAPDYLRDLVEIRVATAPQYSWRWRLREALEYRWSRIRTTERLWVLTRIVGSAATFVLFFAISAAINPIYLDFSSHVPERGGLSQTVRQQLGINVLKSLGLLPLEAQKRPMNSSEPMINDLYLLNFGQSASKSGKDDTVSVVTVVDRSGTAKVQDVLEYPVDSSLLNDFANMIGSARCRPAIQNGRAVDSHLVLTFSKISVYD